METLKPFSLFKVFEFLNLFEKRFKPPEAFLAAGGRIFRFVSYKPGYCVCTHAPVFSVFKHYFLKIKIRM